MIVFRRNGAVTVVLSRAMALRFCQLSANHYVVGLNYESFIPLTTCARFHDIRSLLQAIGRRAEAARQLDHSRWLRRGRRAVRVFGTSSAIIEKIGSSFTVAARAMSNPASRPDPGLPRPGRRACTSM